jgi:hypothetical protein
VPRGHGEYMDRVLFMTGELTTESATSNRAARRPLLLPNTETNENIVLPPSSSHHHRVVLEPGLGKAGEGVTS